MDKLRQAAWTAIHKINRSTGFDEASDNLLMEAASVLRKALDHSGEATEMVIDWEAIDKEQLRRYKEKFGDFEQAEQEPVAWSVFNPRTGKHWYTHESKYTAELYASEYSDNALSMEVKPLYAAPVRTKDLTAQEKANIIYAADHRNPMAMIDATIALYREKNK